MAFKGGGKDSKARIATPPEFRDLLIGMARSVPKKEG
jgi:DNA-binding transcriptional regulator/RsmH inhibitor MraZ